MSHNLLLALSGCVFGSCQRINVCGSVVIVCNFYIIGNVSGDHNYDSHDDEKMRRAYKPKPIMIPVEQPPPPRERKCS